MAKYKKKKLSIGIQDSAAPVKQAVWLVVLSVLFFLTVCFSATGTNKVTGMVLMCVTLLAGILCFPTLRSRIRLPLILLMLMVVMGGISSFYALSGKFALRELLKLVTALCTTLVLLALTPGEGINPGRRIATVLESSAALAGLFSVDLISTRLLSTPLLSFLGQFSSDYINLPGVEPGIRMISIFTNPNIFAGCVGIGVLLSLGLTLSSPGAKERRFHLCCLFVSATAFVLAFSMGATAAIALAFLAFLLLEHKDRRSDLFILMVETLILAAVAVGLTSITSLDTWDGFQPLPLLCLIVGSVLLCLADRFIGCRLGEKLRGRGKLLLLIIVILLVLVLAFALVGYNLTGSVTLDGGETLRRSAYPAPGEYGLSFQGGEGVQVTVETQNRQDTMMHTSTVLYRGDLSTASFTVPEDSEVVYFTFKASRNTTLENLYYYGTESGSVPLGYKLLPDFVANRLQGLFANQNAIQRTVFFEDGIKLFKDSPIVGCGLGAFENAIHRVQSFFYETKYVHNHYIQTLLETGIIGCALFVCLLVVSAICILRSRRKENFHPLTPALGALLVFMAVHGATEVIFSAFPYLPLAYGVFGLINLCCGEGIPTPWLGKKVRSVILIVLAVLILLFVILLGNNMTAFSLTEKHPTFDSLDRAIAMDKYEWADYALSYVMSSINSDVPEEIKAQAEVYAARLAQVNSNTIPLHLTRYYLHHGKIAEGLAMAEKYANYLSASSEAWNNLFSVLIGNELPTEEYRAGVAHIVDLMEQWDSTHMGSIEINPDIQNSLDLILAR